MFFRRLQLPEIDGLSARPGARVDRLGATELTLSRPRKFATLEVKERQPVVACSARRRGSLASCSGILQPGTRFRLHALQPVSSTDCSLCTAHCYAVTAAVRAAVATNCIARQRLRCNMQQSQAGLPPSRCSYRDVMLPVASQRVRVLLRYIQYTRCLARGDYSRWLAGGLG